MTDNNYILYHLHSEDSLLDSQAKYKDYIDKAVEYGMRGIGFSEHGNIFHHVGKREYCKKKGLKFIHGCEVYLTKTLDEKIRDNYHTVLIAKNLDGYYELNALISQSSDDLHTYYKPRISFDEFLQTSDNIISTSACLASPLNQLDSNHPYYDKLCRKYTFLEVQPHHCEEQAAFNNHLIELAQKYNKPIILGTDTHAVDRFGSECRKILKIGKKIEYANEDDFDLTFHSYSEILNLLLSQGCLTQGQCEEALGNTNVLYDMVEDYDLDVTFKYPDLYPDAENLLEKTVFSFYHEKCDVGTIKDTPERTAQLHEEIRVFRKIGMCSFLLFMSELIRWCHDNDIPTGDCRGSVGGSFVAYVLDIIDVDPFVWGTIFSRFANEDRVELGDIDIDFAPDDREKVYEHIINRIGADKTAYILTFNSVADRGTFDEVGRALRYSLDDVKQIKTQYLDIKQNLIDVISKHTAIEIEKAKIDPEDCDKYINAINNNVPCDNSQSVLLSFSEIQKSFMNLKNKHSKFFYYFDGIKGTSISQGIHPAGIVASPITLADNIGIVHYDGKIVTQINMDELHDLNYTKYDILGLKNIQIIRDAYRYAGLKYKRAHEINWNDNLVWGDIITSPIGIFQFEGKFAHKLLQQYRPNKINDLSLVNAAIRPSGASYRDRLISHQFNKNPTSQIDDLLTENNGFLVFQEDTIKFLVEICGFSGSRADTVRRAIGHKNKEQLDKILPEILEGYCAHSKQPKGVAEQEAKQFIKIIQDSSSYQFGYNHSTGYSMIGYRCADLRCHYPIEFVTAYLNAAKDDGDITSGTELAKLKGIKINPIRFRFSKSEYFFDKKSNCIYKGISSIKYCNSKIGEELYSIRNMKFSTFTDFLAYATENISINSRQLDILIKLNFFSEFGGNKKLSTLFGVFNESKIQYKKTYCEKTKTKRIEALRIYESNIPNEIIPIRLQLEYEQENLGSPMTTYPTPRGQGWVMDINTKYSPRIKIYGLNNGVIMDAKIDKKTWSNNQFTRGCVIQISEHRTKPKQKKTDRGFVSVPGTKEFWLTKYKIIEY